MAGLGLDELGLIAKKLTFEPDYTRFRSVCKAWRSAAPKQPQLPWLTATTTSCTKFYQFSFETNKFTEIPELSRQLSSFKNNPHVLIRSSHGWLFSLDLHTKTVSLINPITDSIIYLPNLDSVDYHSYTYDWDCYRLGFGLTSDPGSSVWSEMQHPEFDRRGNIHVCCYSGKLFFTLGSDVFVCEFGDDPSICKLVSLGLNMFEFDNTYLVESDGDLLLVVVYDITYDACKVFKLDFGLQHVKLVELKSLGDRALFLGLLDTSFSLDASRYPGCKKNSIYIPEVWRGFEVPTIIPSMSIYDCEEEDRICLNSLLGEGRSIPCDWFAPSLLT